MFDVFSEQVSKYLAMPWTQRQRAWDTAKTRPGHKTCLEMGSLVLGSPRWLDSDAQRRTKTEVTEDRKKGEARKTELGKRKAKKEKKRKEARVQVWRYASRVQAVCKVVAYMDTCTMFCSANAANHKHEIDNDVIGSAIFWQCFDLLDSISVLLCLYEMSNVEILSFGHCATWNLTRVLTPCHSEWPDAAVGVHWSGFVLLLNEFKRSSSCTSKFVKKDW